MWLFFFLLLFLHLCLYLLLIKTKALNEISMNHMIMMKFLGSRIKFVNVNLQLLSLFLSYFKIKLINKCIFLYKTKYQTFIYF